MDRFRFNVRGLFFVMAFVAFETFASSAETRLVSKREPLISIGSSIEDAEAVLQEQQIGLVRRGFAETRSPDAVDVVADLTFDLGPEMFVRLYYSKSDRRLTGMSVYTFPKNSQSKTTQSIFQAAGIRFEDNGDFSIRFTKPSP